MKKLILLLLILGISIPSFSQLKNENIVGKWKYTVTTDQGDMNGTLNFVEKEGTLSGEVWGDDGSIISLSKIELKEENVLYFELNPDYDLIKVTVKIEGEKFKGSGSTSQGEFALTGEKKE